MKKIKFYIGIDPKDDHLFWDYIFQLNEDTDQVYHVTVGDPWDDPDGYFTYPLFGSWDAYTCFIGGPGFIKSVEHFEQD